MHNELKEFKKNDKFSITILFLNVFLLTITDICFCKFLLFFSPFRNDMKNYKNKNKFHKLNVAKTYFHRLSGGNNIKTNKTNVNGYSLSAKKQKNNKQNGSHLVAS